MRFSVAALALFVASASASIVARQGGFPTCAGPCIANAQLGNCNAQDTKCLCSNSDFVTSTTTCITNSCTGSDLQSAFAGAQALCAQVGVTLTSTPAAVATGSSATGSASGSSASTTATSPSSSSSAGASAGSSASTSAAASQSSSSSSGASTHGVSAIAGLAAVGLAALAL